MDNLFQATLESIPETVRSVWLLDSESSSQELPEFTSDLPLETKMQFSKLGLAPVRKWPTGFQTILN